MHVVVADPGEGAGQAYQVGSGACPESTRQSTARLHAYIDRVMSP